MNALTKSVCGVALGSLLVVGTAACSSSSSGGSTTPTATPTATSVTDVPNASTSLPAGWPSDIPVPDGLRLLRVVQSPTTTTGKIAVYYGSADKNAVVTQMTAGLSSAGYSQKSSAERGPVSISTWSKSGTTVGLNISSTATNVTCSVSVSPLG